MASPELLRKVAERNLNVTQLLYGNSSVYVYRGECVSGGQRYPTAIKLLEHQMGQDAAVMEREINSMLSLQHPNIVKLYDSAWLLVGVKYYLMIAMELCDKSVDKDNEQRRTNRVCWEEDKLWEVIRKLISAFALMQEQGFAHRDIKPMNIFLKQIEPIVGDFGSGNFFRYFDPNLQSTLVGTPVYMSPLQRTALFSQSRAVIHNAFKSDVFSLGLTFYSMASLRDNAGMSAVASNHQLLFENIGALQYSEVFKGLLRWMLAWEEDQRCDFLEIQNWLNSPVQASTPEIIAAPDVPDYDLGQYEPQQPVNPIPDISAVPYAPDYNLEQYYVHQPANPPPEGDAVSYVPDYNPGQYDAQEPANPPPEIGAVSYVPDTNPEQFYAHQPVYSPPVIGAVPYAPDYNPEQYDTHQPTNPLPEIGAAPYVPDSYSGQYYAQPVNQSPEYLYQSSQLPEHPISPPAQNTAHLAPAVEPPDLRKDQMHESVEPSPQSLVPTEPPRTPSVPENRQDPSNVNGEYSKDQKKPGEREPLLSSKYPTNGQLKEKSKEHKKESCDFFSCCCCFSR